MFLMFLHYFLVGNILLGGKRRFISLEGYLVHTIYHISKSLLLLFPDCSVSSLALFISCTSLTRNR